jgi:cyclohexanone monooxygenase
VFTRVWGEACALDAVVFAIGFNAITGALMAMDVRGRDGVALRDEWTDGPRTYLGISSAKFPNMFFVTGPGSPSVLSNVVVSIEQHVELLCDALTHLQSHDLDTIEATAHAQAHWMDHVREVADATLFPKANSWYLGANVPGKPRVFSPYVGGVGTFRHECDAIAANASRVSPSAVTSNSPKRSTSERRNAERPRPLPQGPPGADPR